MEIEIPRHVLEVVEVVKCASERIGLRSFLVGGTVRDITLGIETPDIDFVVEGETKELARKVANILGGANFKYLPSFGTASFEVGELKIDFARARDEEYPYPGAMPKIRFVDDVEKDLRRRDFSANAVAATLEGRIIDPLGGVDDIKNKALRVLHMSSISDDPTRMLRGIRFCAKLGFSLHNDTISSFKLAKDTFRIVAGHRFLAEIRLAQDVMIEFMEMGQKLGTWFLIHPSLSIEGDVETAFMKVKSWVGEGKLKSSVEVFFLPYIMSLDPESVNSIFGRLGVSRTLKDGVYKLLDLYSL